MATSISWAVLGVVAPIASALTGFAAATLSFTAWCARQHPCRSKPIVAPCPRLTDLTVHPFRVSHTRRNLIVPLMFTAFALPVWQALFMAVMLDVVNGLTLSIVYGVKRKVP